MSETPSVVSPTVKGWAGIILSCSLGLLAVLKVTHPYDELLLAVAVVSGVLSGLVVPPPVGLLKLMGASTSTAPAPPESPTPAA